MGEPLKSVDWGPIIQAMIIALIQSGVLQDLLKMLIEWLNSLAPAQRIQAIGQIMKLTGLKLE